MCAFMPASANWSGAMPLTAREPNSGRHAWPGRRPAPSASNAAKYSPAKTTSRRATSSGSSNSPAFASASTARVTAR